MKKYEIEYEVSNLFGKRSERLITLQPINSDSAFNAVAMLAQRIGDSHRNIIDIFNVKELP
jgi:hypothetical protein